jgi:serine/threonine protein kinase
VLLLSTLRPPPSVVKVLDRVRNEQLAIKIIKNKKSFFNQAQIEIRLLEHMASVDVVERAFIIEYRRQFLYCNHLCLEFELLSFNLYDLLKNTGFQGVSLNLVRKFGTQLLQALAFLSSPAINIIHCFPEDDHQLLTNRGFMFLDEVEAHVAFAADGETVVDWRGLEVASYDEKSGQLVYQQPLRLVVNRDTSAPVELFEFTDAAEATRWSADAELPATKNALMTSVTCTGEHSLYVRTGDDVAFRKRTAESLAQCSSGAIQLLAAVGGDAAVSCDSCLYGGDMSLSFIASLELTREQVTPFVELFGMWLGDCGSLQHQCSFVLQTSSDIAFVDSRLRACGLRDDELLRSSTRNECVEICVLRSSWIALFDACRHASDKRFLPWVWQLDAASLRRLIAGLHGSGDSDACIHVTSVNFRDELVRVLLHAGFSATFEASRCVGRVVGWRVMYSADERFTMPVLRRGGDVVRKHSRQVRTWCFTTSAGFVVVRRALRALDGDRAVLKASRATIQSNCDLKPENILLRSPKRSAIKVIDFGSSCYLTQRMYTYIQSRFYRAPEVVLDRGYACAIDMWSLGAILVELHTGEPLFPGRSEVDLMLHMVEVLDMPPDWYIESSPKHQKFFTFRQFELNGPKYRLRQMRSAQGAAFARRPLAIALAAPRRRRANENGHAGADYARFSEAVLGMLTYDPAQRVVPHQALQHPFFATATPTQNE